MQVDTAERWVRIATGPGAALVLLIIAVAALWFQIKGDVRIVMENQARIVSAQERQQEMMREEIAAMLEISELLKQQIATERQLADRIELWLFRNFDSPETP